MSTPVIKALRDSYPNSHIAFMVRPYSRDIVEGNPYLNEVIIYSKEEAEKGILGNMRFVAHLSKKRFDIAIILHPTNRAHLIAFLAGVPERVGYDKKMARFLLTKRISHTKQFGLKHETDYVLDMLRYIGVEPKDKTLYMPMKDESEERIKDVLKINGVYDEGALIAIHPGASCPSKRWPLENFVKVADSIVDLYKAKIVVLSGAREKEFGDTLANSVRKNSINLSGMTTVADLASILRRARLLISNDSGPVHIACAVGTKVLAIFGRNDRGLSPTRWGPTGKDDVILHKDVGCDECLAHNCKIGFKCLEAITVEEVLTAAKEMLKTFDGLKASC